jgi:arabinan endo-1,5-alpha-L-arabinosidase
MDDTYTVSFWTKPTSVSGYSSLMYIGNNGSVSDVNSQIWVSMVGYGLWSMIEGTRTSFSGTQYTNNVWQHYIFSVDKGTASLYKNGALIGTNKANVNAFVGEDKDLYFCVNPWDAEPSALIDEVKVYDAAVTADQAAALHKEESRISKTSEYVNEIAYLSFDSVEDGFSGAGAVAVSGTDAALSDLLYIEEGQDGVLQLQSANKEFLNVKKEDE